MSQGIARRPVYWLFFVLLAAGNHQRASAAVLPPEGPEALIRALYKLVTFPGGTTPDWNAAREMFLDEAVVVLRTSRDSSTVFNVEGWIDDFVRFIDTSPAKEKGFSETIVRMHTVAMGDIANVWVLYEAKLTDRAGQQGVDNFSLVRRGGKWLIASVVNELPLAGFEVPDVLAD